MRRDWLRCILVDGLLVSVWLLSVGMVLLHEGGHLFGGGIKLASSLGATLDAKEQWFGIYYNDEKIGSAKTTIMPEERNGMPGVTVIDQGRLYFTLLGIPQEIAMSAQAFIDADWRLQDFAASVQAADYSLKWSGNRKGDKLILSVTANDSTITRTFPDPRGDAMISGLSSWFAFHHLEVGQWGDVWMLNPLSLKPEIIYFYVRRMEKLNGRDVLVVETDMHGISTTSWVTPDGEVLKEDSPMGWQLIQESEEEAVGPRFGKTPGIDLLSTAAVPLDQPLDDPQGISGMVLLVEGIEAEDIAVERLWQKVLPKEKISEYRAQAPESPWCLLSMERPTLFGAYITEPPGGLKRYLEPSPFIQSDDVRIRSKAEEITSGLRDPWQKAKALHDWVYKTLSKRLTVGFPSATDVLHSKSGDCHEHTVLFTALARSIEIPTRAVAGLVYYHGRLFYHAWPEVWIGKWVPIDPTLGQPIADVTHLGLVEAENEDLIGLVRFVGQMRISILKVMRNTDSVKETGL